MHRRITEDACSIISVFDVYHHTADDLIERECKISLPAGTGFFVGQAIATGRLVLHTTARLYVIV